MSEKKRTLEEIISDAKAPHACSECPIQNCEFMVTKKFRIENTCSVWRIAAAIRERMVELAENQDFPESDEGMKQIRRRGFYWGTMIMLTPVPIGNGEEEVWAKIRRKAGK